MKKLKLLFLLSVAAASVFYPAFMQSAKAADKTISVKLSNYVGNKSSLDVDITGSYEIPGSKIADTERYGGATRYDVANNVASAGWTNPATVVIVNRDAFADALSAAPLAKKYDAPILLTSASKLTAKTESEIAKLNPDNILIIGGTISVSKNVEKTLKKYGSIDRIGGASRYEVSKNIADRMGNYSQAVVATGKVFSDALSIAPYAAMNGYPILLAGDNTFRSDYKIPSKVTIVGGPLSVSTGVEATLKKKASVKRIGGASRYEVSANIVKELNMKANKVFMSNGKTFADALTGSVLAAKQGNPLLLVKSDSLPSSVANVVAEKGTQSFALLGGNISITDSLKNKLSDTFAGTGYSVNLSKGNLVLYKNNTAIKTLGTSFTAQPKKYSTTNSISLNGTPYLGNMKFTIESGKYIRPINVNIPFEDYLKGVVPHEMPASWQKEALKAQAVAARTYSVSYAGKEVKDTTAFQVYGGYDWNSKTSEVVESTRGKVLKYNGNLISATYSSSNGGYSEASGEVWSSQLPYLIAKKDTYDPQISWSLSLNKTQLDKSSLNLKSPGSWWSTKNETNSAYLSGLKSWFIKNKYSRAESIKITNISSVKFSTEKTAGQRPETASVTFSYFVKEKSNGYILSNGSLSEKTATISVPTTELRTMLGASNMKSTYASVSNNTNAFIISGKGYGHGIGMSQYGANARAAAGQSYTTILSFYYPGTTLSSY
ncbi:SpoIID/LytB domain-containing protein [Bacillus spizizenii]|uniref:SpoIID/LytB domain-containing protein n=1 Tax=Bacillus spizizenii TaxID=96241 RepID=UPI0006A9040A|nr:SpoIID/LytB domain-containing protein [Bacillus spizizenii]CUB16489.1 Amidase enhancer precursor [Bacillus cereus]CUB44047.1 Amidase enhancer precursor [Bacillus subtilis]MEC1436175.1 SpoIID/LytB domain-containing protein [Bacillus spizizenii]OPG90085.1 amidase [Bacillus spizizenii]OWV36938.1 amidase [Bacillus spizizenii]